MNDHPVPRRGDVIVTEVVGVGGRTIRKRRPFVIISPDDINQAQFTYLAAPLTTGRFPYHYRIPCNVGGQAGHIVLDQLYTVDATRAGRPRGRVSAGTLRATLDRLREMFAD